MISEGTHERIEQLFGDVDPALIEQLRKDSSKIVFDTFKAKGVIQEQVSLPERLRLVYLIDEALRIAYYDLGSLSIYAVLVKSATGGIIIDKKELLTRVGKLFRISARAENLSKILGEETADKEKPMLLAKVMAEILTKHNQEMSLHTQVSQEPQSTQFTPQTRKIDGYHFDLNAIERAGEDAQFADPHFDTDSARHFSSTGANSHSMTNLNSNAQTPGRPKQPQSATRQNGPDRFALPPLDMTLRQANVSNTSLSFPESSFESSSAPEALEPMPTSKGSVTLFEDRADPNKKPCSSLPISFSEEDEAALKSIQSSDIYSERAIQLILHAAEQNSFYHIVLNDVLYRASFIIGNKRMRDDMTISKIYASLHLLSQDTTESQLCELVSQVLNKFHHDACVSSIDRAYVFYTCLEGSRWTAYAFRPNGGILVVNLGQDRAWDDAVISGIKAGFKKANREKLLGEPIKISIPKDVSDEASSQIVGDAAFAISATFGFKGQAENLTQELAGLAKKAEKSRRKDHEKLITTIRSKLKAAS